jgi:hypothetical protein
MELALQICRVWHDSERRQQEIDRNAGVAACAYQWQPHAPGRFVSKVSPRACDRGKRKSRLRSSVFQIADGVTATEQGAVDRAGRPPMPTCCARDTMPRIREARRIATDRPTVPAASAYWRLRAPGRSDPTRVGRLLCTLARRRANAPRTQWLSMHEVDGALETAGDSPNAVAARSVSPPRVRYA